MAQTSDYFLTDIDIKNLDVCSNDVCQYHNNDYDDGVLTSCSLQQLLNTPCDPALALGEVHGGSITNKKKKSSKKGGAPLVKWTSSLFTEYQAKKGTTASLLTIDETQEMLWFYKKFLPNMEAPGKPAKAVLDLSIVNSLITDYSNGFFAPLAPCFLNGHDHNNPPDTVALIQLDAGHDFLNIRAMAEKLIRQFLFQSKQPLSKYLLIHRHILVPFLRQVTKNLGFSSRFFSSKPNESNILMEIMKKSKFGTRKTYFHSWTDVDFTKNPLLGFHSSPELYVRTQTDIVPAYMPLDNEHMLSYLFPIAQSPVSNNPQITDISPVAKLLDATNKEGLYIPVNNPINSADTVNQGGISKYNESIVEVKKAYLCLEHINLKLTRIANGGQGAKYDFVLEGPLSNPVVPATTFIIEKKGEGKSFLGGQPFCHVLICLIISADYTAEKNHKINKNPLDTEKITERTRLKTYLCSTLLATNSLSNQFKNLESIINLWVELKITTQQFIAIILMTKQLGDYGQASTWCIKDNIDYKVEPDPHKPTESFTDSQNQAIIHITGDKLCMASFAKKISECNSEITNHVGGYWANKKGCFIIYPKHTGFNGPQLLSKLKIPQNVNLLLKGGAQPDSKIAHKKHKKGNWKGGNNIINEKFIKEAIKMITQKCDLIIQTFSKQLPLTEEGLKKEIQNIKENIMREVNDDYYYTAGFDEERLIEFSTFCKDFREKLLYKIEACIHNITTIKCIIDDEGRLAQAKRSRDVTLSGGGGDKRKIEEIDTGVVTGNSIASFREKTATMMDRLSNMSGLYYFFQNVMLFWFNEVESLNLALNDTITRKTKLETKGGVDVDEEGGIDVDEEGGIDVDEEGGMDVNEELKNLNINIVKMTEMHHNKQKRGELLISNFVIRYNDTINKAQNAVRRTQQGGGQKKKNKDIEIKKCAKEKKVEAKEKEKLKEKKKLKKEKEKLKEKLKKEKEKENEKIKKEKLKEKLKKEKEKEKIKKEKLKEKLKKEKEKEKIKKEKLKEKKKETKQKVVKKETKQNKKK